MMEKQYQKKENLTAEERNELKAVVETLELEN